MRLKINGNIVYENVTEQQLIQAFDKFTQENCELILCDSSSLNHYCKAFGRGDSINVEYGISHAIYEAGLNPANTVKNAFLGFLQSNGQFPNVFDWKLNRPKSKIH
ncbi:hypothetical protein JD969_09745 [Planctomycetota bacterium]|nr:hypothetical protein JD969_09745 [Planctomycetota bacterium]